MHGYPSMSESTKIILELRGLGHVPSFKNKKRICGKRLVTEQKTAQWMEQAAEIIASQLHSLSLTSETGTAMECSLRSWILTSLPLDDSLAWIGTLSVNWQRTHKGNEGANITIEQL